jgi:hypothetical protein
MARLLTGIAAWIVLLQALLGGFVLLLMLAARDGGPSRRAFDADWPLSGLLILLSVVLFTCAGFALLRPRLFGGDVGRFSAVLNVATVVAIVLFNAWSFLSSVRHQPGSLPALYLLFLTASALVVLGATLAIWSSWRGRSVGGITS